MNEELFQKGVMNEELVQNGVMIEKFVRNFVMNAKIDSKLLDGTVCNPLNQNLLE